MNILENYLVNEISVDDVTEEYKEKTGYDGEDAVYKVVWEVNCYGSISTVTHYWRDTEYRVNKLRGFYYG